MNVAVGKGRIEAMRALGGNFRGLLKVCPELAEFRTALKKWLEGRKGA